MTGLAVVPPDHPIAVLRDQIAPGAPDAELAYFAKVCARLDLSPFADQIVLIPRHDKRLNRDVYRPQITVAGRRTLAVRTGRLARIEGPVWCGPRDARGELVWQDVWTEDGPDNPPYCARVLIYTVGVDGPAANGTAKWSEFAQYGGNKSDPYLLPMWARMPSHMLGKVAESLALRRAFPDVIDPAIGLDDPYPVVAAEDEDTAERAEIVAEAQPARSLQGEAHRLVGALTDAAEYDRFMADHQIERFSDQWPDAVVADALQRFGPK